MENIFERLTRNRAVISGILFALLISIIFNIFLVIQTIQLDNKLNERNLAIETNEGVSNYEAVISSLERNNLALETQLQELIDGNIEIEEVDIEEVTQSENKPKIPEVIIDKKLSEREELTKFTSEFIEHFLTQSKELDQNRRQNLEPYLATHLLETLVPENQQVGMVFEVEHGEADDTFEGEIEYSIEVIDQSIYIDEASLDEDLPSVLVYVTTQTIINDSSPTNERSIIDVRMNKNDDGLEVNNIYFRFLNENE